MGRVSQEREGHGRRPGGENHWPRTRSCRRDVRGHVGGPCGLDRGAQAWPRAVSPMGGWEQ